MHRCCVHDSDEVFPVQMRTSDADILMVPGWLGSGSEHWQSRWERNLKTARRIEQDDWVVPDKDRWVGRIIETIATTSRPAVLVAHSVGVIAVAHAALKLPEGAVAGAFLVSAADVDRAQDWPVTQGYAWPESGFGFAPVPLAALPFHSALLTSSDDPYCRPERARHFAAAWGSDLVEVGPAGHINTASGHGPWPDGVLRFGTFLSKLDG
jgi:serine hydrolase